MGERGALFAGKAFHFAETPREFGAGFLESNFGIDFEEAGEIDDDEKKIADFRLNGLHTGVRSGGGQGGRGSGGKDVAEFVSFFVEFREDAVDGVPVEADARGLAGELEGLEKRGHGAGDAVKQGGKGG